MEPRRTEALRLLTDEADTFIETLGALRSLKDVAYPQATTLDENPVWQGAITRHAKAVSSEKRERFRVVMAHALPIVLAFANGAGRTYTDLQDVDKEWSDASAIEIVPEELRGEVADAQAKLLEGLPDSDDIVVKRSGTGDFSIHFRDPEIRHHFWEAVREIEKGVATPTHEALLMRSLLTMAVSAFEVLVSNLYRTFLTCNPSAAESPDTKSFSLKELFDFDSVQDAINESIFQQSDAFSRKGIRAWATWFKTKPLEIDLEKLAWGWGETQEIFERRNVVVHNGSRATRQYLRNVDSSLSQGLDEGAPLDVTPEYVDESIERLLTLATLLAYKVRLRLFKRDNLAETSEWISGEQFRLLCASDFNSVQRIAVACSADHDLVAAHQLLLRVNGWIARMRLDGASSCRKELEQWDTSALSEDFRAARLILLGRNEEALASIEDLLAKDRFTEEHLREWPLFHWLRDEGALDHLLAAKAEAEGEPPTDIVIAPRSRDGGSDPLAGPEPLEDEDQ